MRDRNTKTFSLGLLAFFSSLWLPLFACTSWGILPQYSTSGNLLLHKCRDQIADPLGVQLVIKKDVKWLGAGGALVSAMAMNSYGVVVLANAGDNNHALKPNTPSGNRFCKIMRQCRNGQEAVDMMQYLAERGTIIRSINFIGDADKIWLTESCRGNFGSYELKLPFAVVANAWRGSKMQMLSDSSISSNINKGILNCKLREIIVRDALRRMAQKRKGKLSPLDCFAASRIVEDKTNGLPGICRGFGVRAGSIGGTTFEVSKWHPEIFSVMYLALGPQRHSIYVPIPMAVTKLHPALTNGAWGELSRRLLRKLSNQYEDYPNLIEFETKMFWSFQNVYKQARKMAEAGDLFGAAALLDSNCQKQMEQAWSFLSALEEKVNKEKMAE